MDDELLKKCILNESWQKARGNLKDFLFKLHIYDKPLYDELEAGIFYAITHIDGIMDPEVGVIHKKR